MVEPRRGSSPSIPRDRPGADIPVWIFEPPSAERTVVFGLTGEERLRRALAPHGVASFEVGPKPPALDPRSGRAVAVLRGDAVYDERLIAALLAEREVLLASGAGGCEVPLAAVVPPERLEEAARWLAAPVVRREDARIRIVQPADLVPTYTAGLRKVQPPTVALLEERQASKVEKLLFDASYKGVTDFVTKWVWPPVALPATRWLARRGIRPNAVTAASWALVLLATGLFARGEHGLGLLAAWLMTFLDTVDGKLARVTLRSSRVGHVLDHGLDILHPPFWYLAFGVPLLEAGPGWLPLALWVTVAGYVVGRLFEGGFLLAFRFEIHCWRPVDAWFRLFTARRNPNLVLLTTGVLAGRPDLGLGAVAVWTAASVCFHAARLAMAFAARRAGAPPVSWQLAESAAGWNTAA